MYKVGDDLRQDMLTLQMVRIMDKLWLKNGLDLKMVTFACVPTGPKTGFVKLITGAETLRRIQVTNIIHLKMSGQSFPSTRCCCYYYRSLAIY